MGLRLRVECVNRDGAVAKPCNEDRSLENRKQHTGPKIGDQEPGRDHD